MYTDTDINPDWQKYTGMLNDLHDIQCSISHLAKDGLQICGVIYFESKPHCLVQHAHGTT